MAKITAVAKLYAKNPATDDSQTQLVFNADYNDERNKEWARWTPALNLSMHVLNSVAAKFELNENYLLTFEKQ